MATPWASSTLGEEREEALGSPGMGTPTHEVVGAGADAVVVVMVGGGEERSIPQEDSSSVDKARAGGMAMALCMSRARVARATVGFSWKINTSRARVAQAGWGGALR